MKPRAQPVGAFQLFQAHFRQILNHEHPLVQLADKIDWPAFDAAFADSYSADLGAPGKAIRLLVACSTSSTRSTSRTSRWSSAGSRIRTGNTSAALRTCSTKPRSTPAA